jgi:aspartate/glutamate racemase
VALDSRMPPVDPQAERPFIVFYTPEAPGALAGDVIAVFNPATPDRTEAILGRAPSPIPHLLESYRLLHLLGAGRVAIACNTMHYWYDRQKSAGGNPAFFDLPTVHMIEETAEALQRLGVERAGLLATTGTVGTGLYQQAASRRGVAVLVPQASGGRAPDRADAGELLDGRGRARAAVYETFGVGADGSVSEGDFQGLARRLVDLLGEQEGLVMESIYGVRGIKAGSAGGAAERLMREAAGRLVRRGAQALILGCTEVPLVLRGEEERIEGRRVTCLDTTRIAAGRLAAEAGSGRAVGIAGGLGPAATIDMLGKVGVEPPALDFLDRIYLQTVRRLQERRHPAITDQEHLKHIFIRTADPRSYVPKIKRIEPWAVAFAGTAPCGSAAVGTAAAGSARTGTAPAGKGFPPAAGPGRSGRRHAGAAHAWWGFPVRQSVEELVEEGLTRKRGEPPAGSP